jgi:hypothetical protein
MTGAALPDALSGLLRAGAPALVLSVGEDGWPYAAMTWAAAPSPEVVRFIVDDGSTTLSNLRRDGRASLQIIGGGDVVVLIKGPARECRARVAAAAFPMTMWELTVAGVKDQSWAPVAVSALRYEWRGPDAAALRRMEQAVLSELREWRD